jgi:hypothetical protein
MESSRARWEIRWWRLRWSNASARNRLSHATYKNIRSIYTPTYKSPTPITQFSSPTLVLSCPPIEGLNHLAPMARSPTNPRLRKEKSVRRETLCNTASSLPVYFSITKAGNAAKYLCRITFAVSNRPKASNSASSRQCAPPTGASTASGPWNKFTLEDQIKRETGPGPCLKMANAFDTLAAQPGMALMQRYETPLQNMYSHAVRTFKSAKNHRTSRPGR